MASLKDVAALAAVSLMTVSRAINSPEKVHPKTLQRVQHAIDILNYVPDFSARKMRGKNAASTIGVLALDTATTPFSVELLLSIELTALHFGWNTFVINITDEQDTERAMHQLVAQRPDGVIFTSMGLRAIKVPSKLAHYPLVLANCIVPEQDYPCYIPDDFMGQYLAMQTVIQRGYRRPLCFYLPHETLASHERRQAVEQAWLAAGLSLDALTQIHMDWGDEHYRDVIKILEQHIKQGEADFDVVICGNDRVAFLAYQVLLTHHIQIPQQVAVVGYDNLVGVGDLFYPKLTTVQLPHREMGQQAALHLIEGRQHQQRVRLACPFIDRESLVLRQPSETV